MFTVKIFPVILLILAFTGCATGVSNHKPEIQASVIESTPKEKNTQEPYRDVPKKENYCQNNKTSQQHTPGKSDSDPSFAKPAKKTAGLTRLPETIPETIEDSPLLPAPETQNKEKSDQGLLDSALEFCQASNDFWEQGDLENAIDSLDQAYSLILKVKSENNTEILQQREDLRFSISKRITEVYASRFTVANGNHKAIPLSMNRHVQKALNMFKGSRRDFFIDSYRRSGRYRPAILKALKEAGLPEELSWLPLIESGFKVRAFSRARALGMWQFIASTGYKYGLKRDHWIDERMDPKKSTMAAIAYLKELHQIFGDWTTALAGYNCGEGAVLRRIRTQRINYLDHFWDLYKKLPSETAFYVPKFMAVLHIVNDPNAYGITLPQVDKEIESDMVTIDKQVHLKAMAKYLNIPFSDLKGLNPELRHYSTPNRPYAIKMPKGKGKVLLAKLRDIPAWHPPVPAYVRHKVRKGESLSVIARRYKTSVRAIMALNRLKSRRYIKAGWKLKIPTKRKYASAAPLATPARSSPKAKCEIARYKVRKGDSLWNIAKRFQTTTGTIQSLNRLNNSRLRIGQILMIPKRSTDYKKIKTKVYTVSKGDSPYLIARKYQIKLAKFLKLNSLTPRSTIFPGQTLLVRAE